MALTLEMPRGFWTFRRAFWKTSLGPGKLREIIDSRWNYGENIDSVVAITVWNYGENIDNVVAITVWNSEENIDNVVAIIVPWRINTDRRW